MPAHLRLLGGVALEASDGPVTGRAAQKRRLAVLALLAVAPARTISRDKLIAWLWPDADTEQARRLLSVALYEIRRAIGDEALISRGDDIVLGPSISSDVEAFEAALNRGDHEAAVGLYGGPFMDGFHASDTQELERWIDGRRDGLGRAYAQALESCAQVRLSRGDALGAAEIWRRRAVLDPYNARVALGLMTTLDAAGDRAGALQHARVHTLLVQEEFGAAADPEIEALSTRLRRDERLPTHSAPRGMAEHTGTIGAAWLARTAEHISADAPAAIPDAPMSTAGAPLLPLGQPVPAHVAGHHRVGRRRVAAGVVGVAAVGSLVALAISQTNGGAPPVSAAGLHSVAVLPFENLSRPEGVGRFGDGLAEEIISALSRLDELRVVARSSSFAFRGNVDMREVGRRLDVSHALEGTLQIGGDRLRVYARLIDTSSGYEVWSDSYDRPWQMDMVNMLAIQEEIARAVVSELEVRLVGSAQSRRLVTLSTRDPAAALSYSEGREHFHRRTVSSLLQALAHFHRAVSLDSSYALAHAAIAETNTLLGAFDYAALAPATAYEAARAAAKRALATNPDLAEAHAALANVHFNYDWDWHTAEAAYQRATRVSPNFAEAYHWYSLFLSARGRHAEAREAILVALERNPLSMPTLAGLARQHYFAREFDASIAAYRNAVERDSLYVTAHVGLGMAYVQAGRLAEGIAEYRLAAALLGMKAPVISGLLGHALGRAGRAAEARVELAALEAASAGAYVPAEYRAVVHIGLGETERALDALEEAFQRRSGGIAYLAVEPMVDPLRSEPRFRSLSRRARLQ